MTKLSLIYVFIGGGLGSVFRYMLGVFIPYKSGFPLTTFTANILACLCLGLLLGYGISKGMSDHLKLLLLTGFCGGFSTFSTFSGETLEMFQQQQYGLALSYVTLSLVIGMLAVWMGFWLIGR